jgi:hypothetical protein
MIAVPFRIPDAIAQDLAANIENLFDVDSIN